MRTHLQDEVVIDKLFGDIGAKVGRLDEAKEELVDDLEMWPCQFENRFVFFRIKCVACWIDLRRNRSKEVCCKLEVS